MKPGIFRYTNPIIHDRALAMRDHQITKVDELWFMTGTSLPVWEGPNPGVRLLVSADLLHWKHHSWIIDAALLEPGCPYNGRFWAPEIHRAYGRFWLTVNSGHEGPERDARRMEGHNIFLFAADEITGPYKLVSNEPLGAGFKNDASLFTDDDGRTYAYCSGGGLWEAEIDLTLGRLIGGNGFQKIRSPNDTGNPDWMIGGIEGPYVIKRDGSYHLFFSAWTRGYETGVMSSPSPLGPWKLAPNSPIFGTRKRRYREAQMQKDGYSHLAFEDTADPFVEVGHCAIFEGPDGNDWISSHYFIEGKEPIPGSIIPEYYDTAPQLGYEPLQYRDGLFYVNGPTWTEQVVELT